MDIAKIRLVVDPTAQFRIQRAICPANRGIPAWLRSTKPAQGGEFSVAALRMRFLVGIDRDAAGHQSMPVVW